VSFWGRVQTELLDRRKWKTRIELTNALFEYLEMFHNRRRRRSALGGQAIAGRYQRIAATITSDENRNPEKPDCGRRTRPGATTHPPTLPELVIPRRNRLPADTRSGGSAGGRGRSSTPSRVGAVRVRRAGRVGGVASEAPFAAVFAGGGVRVNATGATAPSLCPVQRAAGWAGNNRSRRPRLRNLDGCGSSSKAQDPRSRTGYGGGVPPATRAPN
jgi:integrase-like protein